MSAFMDIVPTTDNRYSYAGEQQQNGKHDERHRSGPGNGRLTVGSASSQMLKPARHRWIPTTQTMLPPGTRLVAPVFRPGSMNTYSRMVLTRVFKLLMRLLN
jgi:hypothetical protein